MTDALSGAGRSLLASSRGGLGSSSGPRESPGEPRRVSQRLLGCAPLNPAAGTWACSRCLRNERVNGRWVGGWWMDGRTDRRRVDGSRWGSEPDAPDTLRACARVAKVRCGPHSRPEPVPRETAARTLAGSNPCSQGRPRLQRSPEPGEPSAGAPKTEAGVALSPLPPAPCFPLRPSSSQPQTPCAVTVFSVKNGVFSTR